MATLTSAGIGSGLNVEGIVNSLMSVERQPVTALTKRQTTIQSQISALGTIKGGLSALQSAAKALTPSVTQTATTAFAGFTTSVADDKILTASASSSAVAGKYSIDVVSLASTQRLALGKTYGTSDPVIDFSGGNTLTFTKPDATTKTVTLDPSANTLGGVRDAINKAGVGVSAAIVTGADGKQNLMLTADNGGTAAAVTVGGTAQFVDPGGGAATAAGSAFATSQAAADSVVKVQGISVKTAGNTITGAVDGLTLTLKTTGSTTLEVSQDNSALKTKLEAFVSAYNSVNSSIKSLGSYNPATKTGAVLNGDGSLRTIQGQLRSTLATPPGGLTGNVRNLSDIGISVQTDGTLALDSAKLNKAAASDFAATAAVVAHYGNAFKTTTTELLDTKGVIASRTDGLNSTVKLLGNRIEALNNRMTMIEKNYRAQFSALDTAMASMSTTSSYLTQQLGLMSSR